MSEEIKYCEVCGATATSGVRDIKEVDPTTDEEGQSWRRWDYDGPAHFYCDTHKRESRQTFQHPPSAEEATQIAISEQLAQMRLIIRNPPKGKADEKT
jgi:hypothetical protein